MDAPPSVDELTAGGWREIAPAEVRRRAGDDDTGSSMSARGVGYTDAARDAVRAAVGSEHDFGGWLSHVLEDVARERGGSHTLVAGRPGCWEADHVRRLAAGADSGVAEGRRVAYVYPEVVAVPGWERRLALAVAAHDLVVAGDRVLGRVSPECSRARDAVVDVIDAALAGGVSEETIDAALARMRTQDAAPELCVSGGMGRWSA